MIEEPSELNPYASPAAEPGEVPAARKRFRWRVILVTLLCVLGGSSLASTVPHFGVGVRWRIRDPSAVDLGVARTAPMLIGDLFGVMAACLSLLTARRVWQGRWWWALLAFSVGVLFCFLCARLDGLQCP